MFAITATLILVIAGVLWYFLDNEEGGKIEWEFSVSAVDGILDSDESENIVYASITMIKGQDIRWEGDDDVQFGFSIKMIDEKGRKMECDQNKATTCTINNDQPDIWKVGETLTLSENFENPIYEICLEESDECELGIQIYIRINTNCNGADCGDIDFSYPKTITSTITIYKSE